MPTIETSVQPLEVKVTQYSIARIRTGQALLPFAMIGSIIARRSLGPTAISVTVALLLATLFCFLSARRGLGVQAFSVRKGGATVGTQLVLAQQRVLRWTLSGDVARLYCAETSLRLVCRTEDRQQLTETLTAWLGRPIQLARRGSQQARLSAVAAAIVGLACTGTAFAYESIALVVVGLPLFVIGLAAFGALSQRVARS